MSRNLLQSLDIAKDNIFLAKQAINTSSHNIANSADKNYSRQKVNITARNPLKINKLMIGNGAMISNIERAHDKFLEKQIIDINQKYNASKSKYNLISNIEKIYDKDIKNLIYNNLNNFFNALQDLSNFPDDLSFRTYVKESAQDLIDGFKKIDSILNNFYTNIKQKIDIDLNEINSILKNISKINQKIVELENTNKANANDLRDKQDLLISNLSDKININYYQDKYGRLIIRGPGNNLLLEGLSYIKFHRLGFNDSVVISDFSNNNFKDITKDIISGSLAANLKIKNSFIPNLIKENNKIAFNIVKNFNNFHKKGYGLNSYSNTNGRLFFKDLKNADNISDLLGLSDEIIKSTDSISAALSPNSPGDNRLLNDLISIKDKKIIDNKHTIIDYYANHIANIGLKSMEAKNDLDSNKMIYDDILSRKQNFSGVSIDEETANIMKLQNNFKASSNIIKTIDQMFKMILDI